MRRTELNTRSIETRSDDQFTLTQDIRRILQTSAEYQQYAQHCYDLLNYSAEAERFQKALTQLDTFIFTLETIANANCETSGLYKNRLFYTFPRDEVYLLLKRVLTFTRNRDEPMLELVDVSTGNAHF